MKNVYLQSSCTTVTTARAYLRSYYTCIVLVDKALKELSDALDGYLENTEITKYSLIGFYIEICS